MQQLSVTDPRPAAASPPVRRGVPHHRCRYLLPLPAVTQRPLAPRIAAALSADAAASASTSDAACNRSGMRWLPESHKGKSETSHLLSEVGHEELEKTQRDESGQLAGPEP